METNEQTDGEQEPERGSLLVLAQKGFRLEASEGGLVGGQSLCSSTENNPRENMNARALPPLPFLALPGVSSIPMPLSLIQDTHTPSHSRI